MKKIYETLEKYWHFSEFIYPQKEIIESVLQQVDTLAILPTGGGKSICYQIPAVMQEGITLVISPLIALMNDQIQSLGSKGIHSAAITSELNPQELENLYQSCLNGEIKILYVSPERLGKLSFIEFLVQLKLSLLAVDEAHCIAQWGHDFRPAYKKINLLIEKFPNTPVLALTATATPKVQKEIIEALQLKNPSIFKRSLRRKNLIYTVRNETNLHDSLVYELKKHKGSSIVFCRTRKEVYDMYKFLQAKDLNVEFFHSKLIPDEKKAKQIKWMKSDDQIMVSTNAFGMGIDKSDVKNVIHLGLPQSLETYVQEAGRAGRNGEISYATLLFNHESIETVEKIFKSNLPKRSEFYDVTRMIYNHFEIGENEKPERDYKFDLNVFVKKFTFNKKKTEKILKYLHEKELIQLQNKPKYSTVHVLILPIKANFPKPISYSLLENLVRIYPGILQEEKPISEFHLAQSIGKSTKKTKEILQQLSDAGYLIYNQRNVQKLRFLEPRRLDFLKHKIWKEFESHQILQWKRLQDMIYYARQTETCREKLILRYFGEKPVQNCGNCDICLPNYSSINKSNILEFLKKSPKNLQEIFLHFSHFPKEAILVTLQDLCDENQIETIHINTYQIKKI